MDIYQSMEIPKESLLEERIESFLHALRSIGISESEYARIKDAMALADEIHRGDIRKNGLEYMHHLLDVAFSSSINSTPSTKATMIILALLHDALEDHPTEYEKILDFVSIRELSDLIRVATGGIPAEIRAKMQDKISTRARIDQSLSFQKIQANRCIELLDNEHAFPLFYRHLSPYKNISPRIPEEYLEHLQHRNFDKKWGASLWQFQDSRTITIKISDFLSNISDLRERIQENSGFLEKRIAKFKLLAYTARLLRNPEINREISQIESLMESEKRKLDLILSEK